MGEHCGEFRASVDSINSLYGFFCYFPTICHNGLSALFAVGLVNGSGVWKTEREKYEFKRVYGLDDDEPFIIISSKMFSAAHLF